MSLSFVTALEQGFNENMNSVRSRAEHAVAEHVEGKQMFHGTYRGKPKLLENCGGSNVYLWPGFAVKATSVAHLPEATPSPTSPTPVSPRHQAAAVVAH